jgi:hypothetical protein
LLGGVGRHADDVGRGLLHSVDDIGRGAVHQVDDLGRIGVGAGDDIFREANDMFRSPRALGSPGDEAVSYRPYAGSSDSSNDMSVVHPLLREVASQSIQHAVPRDHEPVE